MSTLLRMGARFQRVRFPERHPDPSEPASLPESFTGTAGESRRAQRWLAWLSKRSTAFWIIVASELLCAVTIPTGLVLDDNFHAVAFDHAAPPGAKRAPWDGFAFAKDPASIERMIDEGVFPWWSDLQARIAFFRPLTSLTLWLDHELWQASPAWMHVHSLLWYALLLGVVLAVYRRFSSSPAFAALALAAYALDDARAIGVGYLANRGSLLALGCGFAAILAHDSWRSSGRKRWLAASLGLLAVGLLCGESALQAFGYLIAYTLFLDAGTKRERFASLAPAALVLVVWRCAYVALGYGAARTDLYIDPAREPARFFRAACGRLPILVAAQFSGISADLGDTLKYVAPGAMKLLLPLGLVCTGILIWLLTPLWKSRRDVRFWATGTLLSTLPVLAVAPSDRLLTATALGGSALVATLLLAIVDRSAAYRPRLRRWVGISMGITNLVIAPLLLPVQCYSLFYLDRYVEHAEASIPTGPAIADKTVVILNPPTDEYGTYVPFHRQVHGRTMPEHIRWLATADNDLHVTRLDRFSLQIRPGRGFLPPGSIWMLRSPKTRSHVGETLELTGVTYRVTDVTTDGRPAEIIARFDAPLDAEKFVWLQWGDKGGYVPFSLPAPGESVWLPAVDFRSVLNTI